MIQYSVWYSSKKERIKHKMGGQGVRLSGPDCKIFWPTWMEWDRYMGWHIGMGQLWNLSWPNALPHLLPDIQIHAKVSKLHHMHYTASVSHSPFFLLLLLLQTLSFFVSSFSFPPPPCFCLYSNSLSFLSIPSFLFHYFTYLPSFSFSFAFSFHHLCVHNIILVSCDYGM